MFSNSSFAGRNELTDAALEAAAPSIFARGAIEGVSDRYTFIPTSAIVTQMRCAGWAPVNAEAQRVRLAGRMGFQKHMVKFQRREALARATVGEFSPEIALVNSHDRSSGFQLHCALYRFVCANGLMVSDTVFQHVSIRHSGREVEEVVAASFKMLDQMPQLTESVNAFRARQLTPAEQTEFARQAIILRWEDTAKAPVGTDRILRPRRMDDGGNDLWRVFNRIQENLIRGGQRDYSRRDEQGKHFQQSRAVTGLDENVRLNKELWALAENFRQN